LALFLLNQWASEFNEYSDVARRMWAARRRALAVLQAPSAIHSTIEQRFFIVSAPSKASSNTKQQSTVPLDQQLGESVLDQK
jgi:hypothetical protein